MKATGERFTMRERQLLTESVINNLVWDTVERWTIKVTPAAKKNQMVISIHRTTKPYHNRKKRADAKRIRRRPPV
jgi:hypothetical protein